MLRLNLDLNEAKELNERIRAIADELLIRSAEDLAAMVYNKIVELAQARLRSTREQYLQNLSYDSTGRGAWVVTLKQEALWIEEGMPRHEMIDDLVRNGKIAKDGSRYRVIPMGIKKASQTPLGAMPIRMAAMQALKKAKINMKEIEREVDGRPKIGMLHRLDVMTSPIKTAEGAHQGWGAVGSVRQGASGTPFLKGMAVVQRNIQWQAGGMLQRQAMTFRVVSTKHKGTGRWTHPGIQAKKLMDEAHAWALKEWDHTIKPEILGLVQQAAAGDEPPRG